MSHNCLTYPSYTWTSPGACIKCWQHTFLQSTDNVIVGFHTCPINISTVLLCYSPPLGEQYWPKFPGREPSSPAVSTNLFASEPGTGTACWTIPRPLPLYCLVGFPLTQMSTQSFYILRTETCSGMEQGIRAKCEDTVKLLLARHISLIRKFRTSGQILK